MARLRVRRLRGIGDRPIRIVEVEAEEASPSPSPLDLALRTLARTMIRSYQEKGDGVAIVGGDSRGSTLTVAASPSPDHSDDEAA